MTARWLAVAALALAAGACTNVAQMEARYRAGDQAQLGRLLDIAGRPDYPYATRRQAVRALGQIADPRSVPALTGILGEYDQRTTLKEESLKALGRIGDRSAVDPIGRLLDMSLEDQMSDLRLASLGALGTIGGPKAADILIRAIRYYDILTLQKDQSGRRGVFSGEERFFMSSPDSLRTRRRDDPGLGMFVDGSAPYSMFGPSAGSPLPQVYDTVPDERKAAHAALVRVGAEAVPVIEQFLATQEASVTLQNELRAIASEIALPAGPTPSATPGQPAPPP
jgi:hypothetical protein